MTDFVLTLHCPDQVGVVSTVASQLSQARAFITDISQYSDPESRMFFSRTVFDDREMTVGFDVFKSAMADLAADMGMSYTLRPVQQHQKVLIAVSQYDHCLNALLTKWHSGALPIDVVGIISNHKTCEAMARFYGLPFYFLPVTTETKPQQEQQVARLMDRYEVDLLVLARYMQILSGTFCDQYSGKIMNIHHSFLPGFKGARPYHQAHARGVKVIGATAHYATSDLDEGPIIVQEVRSIDHRVTVPQMVHIGHDLEATALATAVKLHVEERVILNGVRTVTL